MSGVLTRSDKFQIDILQGEIIGMRIVPGGAEHKMQYVQGALYFDDGGMRGLACALVWCALIHHGSTLKDEDFINPSVAELARSLLAIPTFYKNQSQDEGIEMIRRIIKQNVDAKKQAVSSYEWSMILKNLGALNNTLGKDLTVQDAMDLYNANPEVAAHGGTGKDRCIRWASNLNQDF